MRALQRYALLGFLVVSLTATVAILHARNRPPRDTTSDDFQFDRLSSFWSGYHSKWSDRGRNSSRNTDNHPELCRFHSCFEFDRCRNGFRVYIYPLEDGQAVSATYMKLLSAIRRSRFYTSNPEEACLFVPNVDTLDRDILSDEYVRSAQARLWNLPHWNGGRNHLIFNLFSGSWPDYSQDLGFDPGLAMLAKSSAPETIFRPGYDISIPLFPRTHPEIGGEPGFSSSESKIITPLRKRFLLTFKGKRYLYGIGSEIRNSLFHLNNVNDVLLLTTCKHGKQWKLKKDERCDSDNADYDKQDYTVLMQNSTFCLVPRGRRLGSFRFLESLQAGCIPIVLSNDWRLPFDEVIDWKSATIRWDERLLFQLPHFLRSSGLTPDSARVAQLRQQSQILWGSYLNSIEKIVQTTLQIIADRVESEQAKSITSWNTFPGALHSVQSEFTWRRWNLPWNSCWSQQSCGRPLAADVSTGNQRQVASLTKFTAVVYTTLPYTRQSFPQTQLYRLLKNVLKSKHCDKILLLLNMENYPRSREPRENNRTEKFSDGDLLLNAKLPSSVVPIRVSKTSDRFRPFEQIVTDAVLSLDEDVTLTTEEIDFAFLVWKQFRQQIVGYPARSHFWDERRSRWSYSSKWSNEYSMVLTSAAFYHSYYNALFTSLLTPRLIDFVNQVQNCEDILMNFLVTDVTSLPPVKVTQRKQYRDTSNAGVGAVGALNNHFPSAWNDPDHFRQRGECVARFASEFGRVALAHSVARYDPVLFKDPVSNLRKRFKIIDRIGSSGA
ncbi:exostosin-1a [Galendromus occidentalis]|uniref:Exostosin-1a n=1 Tax=Galendromus occidentalis TaxID=34638 RepID=A0AAJ7PA24_9ACAR|nr:exostosin-1a [Galendromus occidentalis]